MRRIQSVAILCGFALLTVLCAAPANASPTVNYVALGDSYSAGVGAGNYVNASCGRSSNAYSALWAKQHAPKSYSSVACSGAVTSTVISKQVSALSSATTLVSINVGGNDIGFSDVMTTCTTRGSTDCVTAVNKAEGIARTLLPGRLDAVYNAIATKAPSAQVVVLNYPRFYATGAGTCAGMSVVSQVKIEEGNDVLSAVTMAAATRHGFTFADVRPSFVGHELCTSSPWMNPVTLSNLSSSYHPSANGQGGGYLPVFSSAVSAG